MKQRKIYNIIVAAGSGSRFGGDTPKQFCLLNGRPVLMHSIERINQATPGSTTVIVLNPDHICLWNELCATYSFSSPHIINGGSTRWGSVKNAIDYFVNNNGDASIITVHDGARPLVNNALIQRVIDAASTHSGAIPAVAVTDSLRTVNPDGTSRPIDRSKIRAVQTPQAFNAGQLIKAYKMPFDPAFTDDASVMVAAGHDDIALVEGDSHNIKITLHDDLAIASIFLANEVTANS